MVCRCRHHPHWSIWLFINILPWSHYLKTEHTRWWNKSLVREPSFILRIARSCAYRRNFLKSGESRDRIIAPNQGTWDMKMPSLQQKGSQSCKRPGKLEISESYFCARSNFSNRLMTSPSRINSEPPPKLQRIRVSWDTIVWWYILHTLHQSSRRNYNVSLVEFNHDRKGIIATYLKNVIHGVRFMASFMFFADKTSINCRILLITKLS